MPAEVVLAVQADVVVGEQAGAAAVAEEAEVDAPASRIAQVAAADVQVEVVSGEQVGTAEVAEETEVSELADTQVSGFLA